MNGKAFLLTAFALSGCGGGESVVEVVPGASRGRRAWPGSLPQHLPRMPRHRCEGDPRRWRRPHGEHFHPVEERCRARRFREDGPHDERSDEQDRHRDASLWFQSEAQRIKRSSTPSPTFARSRWSPRRPRMEATRKTRRIVREGHFRERRLRLASNSSGKRQNETVNEVEEGRHRRDFQDLRIRVTVASETRMIFLRHFVSVSRHLQREVEGCLLR